MTKAAGLGVPVLSLATVWPRILLLTLLAPLRGAWPSFSKARPGSPDEPVLHVLVYANGGITDRWNTHILLPQVDFGLAATLVTSVV